MATTLGIDERIAVIARELSKEMGAVDESMGVCWLDALENRAVEIGDAIAAELARLQSQRRPVDDESACPQCGQPGRFRELRERELIGRRGPISIAEPEYYCPCCRKAFFPDGESDRS